MAASYFECFCFSLCVSVWVCAHEHRYRGGQVPDCLELLLQVVVSSPTKVQGTKLDSSTRAVGTLNLGTMSPDPSSGCFKQDCHLYHKPLSTKLISYF